MSGNNNQGGGLGGGILGVAFMACVIIAGVHACTDSAHATEKTTPASSDESVTDKPAQDVRKLSL